MADASIRCPNCGTTIPVSQALAEQVRAELESSISAQAEARTRKAVEEAETRARNALAIDLQDLRAQLAEKDGKVKEAQQQELALRKTARELEERGRELDLELARRLAEETAKIEQGIRKRAGEEQSLKLREKEKQIEDLRRALEDAKRKSEQGSQQIQGEVVEIDIEAALAARFPADVIQPVLTGMRGADIVQVVHDGALQPCGSIIWEVKNTKHWIPGWVQKLKDDQRAAGAGLAVIVSVALPADIRTFGRIDGVWVAGLDAYLALATALREQLIQVAFARNALVGKNEKMELLYQYLSGDEFRSRVEAIVETFSAMQEQLQRERRAMEKLWKEREKQIERMSLNTVGMYGSLRGIIGASLPQIAALELDRPTLLQDSLLEHRGSDGANA